MRKTKEQVQLERQERQDTAAELKRAEYTERLELEIKQKQEREAMRARHAARRKKNATTAAGGKRPGAGRKPSLPHKPCIAEGKDLNPRKTMTFYGSQDEKEPVKNFLNVWRELRFNIPADARADGLEELPAEILYKLMTKTTMTEEERETLEGIFPTLDKYAVTRDRILEEYK